MFLHDDKDSKDFRYMFLMNTAKEIMVNRISQDGKEMRLVMKFPYDRVTTYSDEPWVNIPN